MRYKRARYLALGCGLLAAVALFAGVGKHPRTVRTIEADTSLTKAVITSDQPGQIKVSARSTFTHAFKDATFWYLITIRPWSGGGILWEHHFDQPKNLRKGKQGTPTLIDLPPTAIPRQFPPGIYAVSIDLAEDTPHADRLGNVVLPYHLRPVQMARIEVK